MAGQAKDRTGPETGGPAAGGLLVVSAGLVGYNAALNLVPLPDPLYVPANVGLTGAVLWGVGRRWGLAPADVGLRRAGLGRGLLVGGAVAAGAAAALASARSVPAVAPLLADERAAGVTTAAAAFHALVRIPLGTALPEEVLFRGVLAEGYARRLPRGWGLLAANAVFGLWHVGPTLRLLDVNGVHGGASRAQAVGGAVLATTLAGTGLSLLRRWGRGLAAPILAHACVNAASLLAAVAYQRGR